MVARLHRIALAAALLIAALSARAEAEAHKVGGLVETWCQDDSYGGITIVAAGATDSVWIVVHHDEDVRQLELRVHGRELHEPAWGRETLVDLHADGVDDATSITITPIAAGMACLQDVEIFTDSDTSERTRAIAEMRQDEDAKATKATHARWLAILASPQTPSVPSRRVAARAAPAPHRIVTDAVTTDALARAPDAIRALRLGLEDCDVDALSAWVTYPLRAGDVTYGDAAAHHDACTRGDATAIAPSAAVVTDALSKLRSDEIGQIALPVGAATWRFAWRKGQWWLASID